MFWQLALSNKKGIRAEKQALQFLKKQGLQLIARNFACRTGEVDLIMLHQNTLVFIEVRFRSRSSYGSAAASVTLRKQQKIRRTAALYLQKHPKHQHRTCRFDVVAVSDDDDNGEKSLEWLKSAF